METWSGEYGFICYWSKYKNVWVKEVARLIRMPCVKWRMSYLQFVVILFVAKKQTSRMLGSIVSCLCRSSIGGSIIFICPDHFVGLFVLWSNWRLRVHVLGHFSKTIDLRGHMPRFTLKMNIFSIYLLGNTINLCWNPHNSAHFSETIDLRGHMPMFTLKMNVFPSISSKTP